MGFIVLVAEKEGRWLSYIFKGGRIPEGLIVEADTRLYELFDKAWDFAQTTTRVRQHIHD